MLRQIELRGPDKTPTVAAALAEWPNPDRDGLAAVQAYEAKYGGLADQPITEWDEDFPRVEVERIEFDTVWRQARAHLAPFEVTHCEAVRRRTDEVIGGYT